MITDQWSKLLLFQQSLTRIHASSDFKFNNVFSASNLLLFQQSLARIDISAVVWAKRCRKIKSFVLGWAGVKMTLFLQFFVCRPCQSSFIWKERLLLGLYYCWNKTAEVFLKSTRPGGLFLCSVITVYYSQDLQYFYDGVCKFVIYRGLA